MARPGWHAARLLMVVMAAGVAGPSTPADHADAASGARAQARMTADALAGKPIVVHVVVALCDNAHQGIVPVPKRLGDGRDPASNLYWGARYGVRSYLSR